MFTANRSYLDADVLVSYLLGRRRLDRRFFVSIDSLVEAVDAIRKCSSVSEAEVVGRLDHLLHHPGNVFEDPTVLHTALSEVGGGKTLRDGMASARAEYLRKRGFAAR